MESREARDVIMRMYKGDPTDIQKEALDLVYKILDIDLTPEQIRELKERDTGMLLEDIRGKKDKDHIRFGTCPNCRKLVSDVEGENFCKNCGQRLKWEE